MKASEVIANLQRRFPNEPEYIQAVSQVLGTIEEEYNKHPEFEKANLIERLCIPDRVIEFRVSWVDDKVSFEQTLGYHVDYCPFSEVMTFFDKVKDEDVDALVHDVYFKEYVVADELKDEKSLGYKKIWNSAKAELTLRAVMKAYGAKGFTTNFDDLGDVNVEETGRGFDQIPGLASQRSDALG